MSTALRISRPPGQRGGCQMASVTVFVLMFMPHQARLTGSCAYGALGFVGVIALDWVLVVGQRGPSRCGGPAPGQGGGVAIAGAPGRSQTPVFTEPGWLEAGVSDLLGGTETKELQSRDLSVPSVDLTTPSPPRLNLQSQPDGLV